MQNNTQVLMDNAVRQMEEQPCDNYQQEAVAFSMSQRPQRALAQDSDSENDSKASSSDSDDEEAPKLVSSPGETSSAKKNKDSICANKMFVFLSTFCIVLLLATVVTVSVVFGCSKKAGNKQSNSPSVPAPGPKPAPKPQALTNFDLVIKECNDEERVATFVFCSLKDLKIKYTESAKACAPNNNCEDSPDLAMQKFFRYLDTAALLEVSEALKKRWINVQKTGTIDRLNEDFLLVRKGTMELSRRKWNTGTNSYDRIKQDLVAGDAFGREKFSKNKRLFQAFHRKLNENVQADAAIQNAAKANDGVEVKNTSNAGATVLRLYHADYLKILKRRAERVALVRNVAAFVSLTDSEVQEIAQYLELHHMSEEDEIIADNAPNSLDDVAHHSKIFLLSSGEVTSNTIVGESSYKFSFSRSEGDNEDTSRIRTPLFVPREMQKGDNRQIIQQNTVTSDKAEVFALAFDNDEIKESKLSSEFQEKVKGLIASISYSLTGGSTAIQVSDSDPRKVLTTYLEDNAQTLGEHSFLVVRPCSPDAISKMLQNVAVGKGLDIKGKSAKKGQLSGYVPFMQIHGGEDQKEKSNKILADKAKERNFSGRVHIYYQSAEARQKAFDMMIETALEKGPLANDSDVENWKINKIVDLDAAHKFGLDVPQLVVRQFYIAKGEIEQKPGYETGRPSNPDFQEFNFEAVLAGAEKFSQATAAAEKGPYAVLYQFDESKPENPMTLLMSYRSFKDSAKAFVKPVVSDFDLLLVGEKAENIGRLESVAANNSENAPMVKEIAKWEVDNALKLMRKLFKESDDKLVLQDPNKSWLGEWTPFFKKIHKEYEHNLYPSPHGFGDQKSLKTIDEMVKLFADNSGAVRHGAESFNLGFPQDLDEELLVIQANKGQESVQYMKLDELTKFLTRKAEGKDVDGQQTQKKYVFPLNPAWILRDGWVSMYEAQKGAFGTWYGQGVAGIIDVWLPEMKKYRAEL